MKLLLLDRRCHGHMAIPIIAQMYDPRRMLIHRGNNAVMSVPAEILFAAMLVPSWASVNAAAITKTPKRVAPPAFGCSRKRWRRSSGSQIGSPPKMTVDEELAMMPIKLVNANPIGMVNSCDHKASLGLLANRAKSGLFTINAAKLAMALMMPLMIAQARSLPWIVEGCLTIGPRPPAATIAQMKKAMPAAGATKDLTVKRWRILYTGNHKNGSEPSQNRKKETKSLVLVPDEAGIVF